MSNLRVIDVTTGEDVSEGKRITDVKQAAAYRYTKEKQGKAPDFTFSSMINIGEVIAKINDKHCGYLLYLQCFINYNGVLVKPTHDKEPMTKADIMEVIGLQKSAFYEFFNAMIYNEVIHEESGQYRINSEYHFKGKTDNQFVIKSFTAKIRKLFNGRNAKKLGFIYKLLPYIHFETNTVCSNPYDNNVDNIRQLSKGDIASLTGVSEKTVYSYLRKMKLGDEFVFAEIRRGNEKYYKLNPFIFYRKNGQPDATLREMFRLGFSGK